MPVLHWTGKDKVVKHHLDVPYRVLDEKYRYGNADAATDNKIIHGDNLEALKSLLPQYEGRIKCIYIDPPYNTGNQSWIYNDAVDHPKIRSWIGEVVGKEGEDLTRHDKWLCMVYPRLRILRRLMTFDGVLFASIDDTELGSLEVVLDEVFGRRNRIGKIVWRNATDNNPTQISGEHEYIVCYARDRSYQPKEWKAVTIDVKDHLMSLADRLIAEFHDPVQLQTEYTKWYRANRPYMWPFSDYKFIDHGGIYTGSRSVHNPGKEGYRYDVMHPRTQKPCQEPMMGYRFPESTMKDLLAEDRIIFGDDESKIIELKLYVQDYRSKLSSVVELDGRKGTNEIKAIFPDSKRPFDFPKPSELIESLISFVTSESDIILDSFAGSGTTAHAVLNLNSRDGHSRRFILVELEDYADSITAERVKRAIDGYGDGNSAVEGTGGGFAFYELGEPLFHETGLVNDALDASHLRSYIWFTETGQNEYLDTSHSENPNYLGSSNGASYYVVHNAEGTGTLDFDFLGSIDVSDEQYVIYADRCLIDDEVLRKHGIVFKKIPRDIVRF